MGLRVLTVIEGSDAEAQTLGYSRALAGNENGAQDYIFNAYSCTDLEP